MSQNSQSGYIAFGCLGFSIEGLRFLTHDIADTNHHRNSENKKAWRRGVARVFFVGLRL